MGDMNRRIRMRRIFKWVCTGSCASLAIFWIVSLYRNISYTPGGPWEFTTHPGALMIIKDSDYYWHYSRLEVRPYYWEHPQFWWVHSSTKGNNDFYVFVPIWMILLPIVPVSFWIWHSDRHPKSGCINCRYNLTGNVSGVCPECGSVIEIT